MVANFLIGLREGLEAALVVSILVAYLVKSDRRQLLTWIWLGVGTAVVAERRVLRCADLGLQSRQLTFKTQELIGGRCRSSPCAFVTWMIFWMATRREVDRGRAARPRRRRQPSAGWSFGLVAVLAVGREGMETALFLWTATRTATGRDLSDSAPVTSEPLIAAVARHRWSRW